MSDNRPVLSSIDVELVLSGKIDRTDVDSRGEGERDYWLGFRRLLQHKRQSGCISNPGLS